MAASLRVPPCMPLWQVIFKAVGAGGDHGYIALDDLQVSDGACPKPGESPCCRSTVDWPGDVGTPWWHMAAGMGTAHPIHHSSALAAGHPAPALSLA